MEPTTATIGFSVITILQLANLIWTGRLGSKIEDAVTDKQCIERKKACIELHRIEDIAIDKNIAGLRHDVDTHVHNGGGNVKYPAGGC